jgi:glycosyltransferase involved in cell wall biosynthesis
MQLQWNFYLNSSGYSIASQCYLLACLKTDPELNLHLNYMNVGTPGVSKNRLQLFHKYIKNPVSYPQINVYHCIPHRYRCPEKSSKNIGICLFETMNPPADWVRKMNEMDLIITASQFNKHVFESNGVKVPIEVVPHTFDVNMFNDKVKPNGRYGLKTFISIGTWKIRKNWECLIKAFYDAFERIDGVCLLVKTERPRDFELLVKKIKATGEWRSKDTAPVFVEPKQVCDFEEIPAFMKKGDYYISCSLGEGFCLPSFHSMALNIPIIVPKYSGFMEYAKPEFCTHIVPKHYKTYPTMDGIPQYRHCIWPVYKVSEVRDRMLEVAKNPPLDKAKKGYEFVHNNFNYDVIGKKLLETILA